MLVDCCHLRYNPYLLNNEGRAFIEYLAKHAQLQPHHAELMLQRLTSARCRCAANAHSFSPNLSITESRHCIWLRYIWLSTQLPTHIDAIVRCSREGQLGRCSQYAVISESHRTPIPKKCVPQRVFGRSVYERDEVTALILQLLADMGSSGQQVRPDLYVPSNSSVFSVSVCQSLSICTVER